MSKKQRYLIFIPIIVLLLLFAGFKVATKVNLNPSKTVGEAVDSFNGVKVYYNGAVSHIDGRNLTKDGYNLGLKYQCVEFIKRYYYERFNHKMPDSYGHAKHFYDTNIKSGVINPKRGLLQFANGTEKPQIEDIIIFRTKLTNPYGHVAIISQVTDTHIEIIQQNPGPFGDSREIIPLAQQGNNWTIESRYVLGVLRHPAIVINPEVTNKN